jgi:hypothetical protein
MSSKGTCDDALREALRALLAQPDPVATENLIDAPFGSRFQIGSPKWSHLTADRVQHAQNCAVMYASARDRCPGPQNVAPHSRRAAGPPGAGDNRILDRREIACCGGSCVGGGCGSPNEDRRKLAARAYRLGRHALRHVATIVTPDTLLRWHRQLIARKWTYRKSGTRRRRVLADIRQLVGRMAEENPTWGYTRIQGALKNLGHHVGRSTIARILWSNGISPVPERPTSWQAFLRAHWGQIAAADFFTTEVWTAPRRYLDSGAGHYGLRIDLWRNRSTAALRFC